MKFPAAALLLACLLAASGAASAQDDVEAQGLGRFRPIRNPPNTFVANLRGSNTYANALLVVTVDSEARTAEYKFTVNNVKGYLRGHIHQGVAEDGGPLVALLLPGLAPNTSNEIATGADAPNIDAIDICTMTYSSIITEDDLIQFAGNSFDWEDFESNIRAGMLYSDIHTVDAPAGLIRGQLRANRNRKYSQGLTCAPRSFRSTKP